MSHPIVSFSGKEVLVLAKLLARSGHKIWALKLIRKALECDLREAMIYLKSGNLEFAYAVEDQFDRVGETLTILARALDNGLPVYWVSTDNGPRTVAESDLDHLPPAR